MKYKIITSVGLLLVFVTTSVGQPAEKKLKDLIIEFYSRYDLSSTRYPHVEWEKRGLKWYIKTYVFEGDDYNLSKPQLFYDGRSDSFNQLNFETKTGFDTVSYKEHVTDQDEYSFNIQPFYGYNGWFEDVITEYGAITKPTDDELYALGRAYSSKAIAPVTNPNRDIDAADTYKFRFGSNGLTSRQWKDFALAEDSAISKFRQLSLRMPKYPTPVGDIRDKYANEIMVKYHILMSFANDVVKGMELPTRIYKDSILQICRNYLTACPHGAIFVSFGDNDFYPLLYLQAKEKLRRDVYIFNYNLIAIDKFIYRITEPQFEAEGISMISDSSLYVGPANEIIYIKDSAAKITINDFLQLLASKKNIGNRTTIAADTISINLKVNKREKGETLIGSVANVSIKETHYLLKNHWIFLTILNNLNGRKIVFPNDFFDELRGLNDYINLKGTLIEYDN